MTVLSLFLPLYSNSHYPKDNTMNNFSLAIVLVNHSIQKG